MKRVMIGGLIAAAGLLVLSPAFAQNRPPQRQQPARGALAQRRPAPQNHLAELKAAAEALAKQHEVRIVVDPSLWVPGKPKAPDQSLSLNAALDYLAGQVRKASWKKVYLKGVQGVTIPADKLAESVRAVDAIEQAGLVVETPGTRRASTIIKNYEVSEEFGKDLEAQQFDSGGIYVIYNTTPGIAMGKSTTDRLADMQRESMELMMQLDDQQLQDAVQRGLDMFMNMDPGLRSKFMGMQMRAGMQAFMNMPADQRNQLMQEMMQFGQGMFGGQGAPPGRRP